jgi:predicted acetyltransferase
MSEMEFRREPQAGRTRIELLVDGEHASGLLVLDLFVRIGEAVVRCGGIGGVHTEVPYRMRGYARQVIDEGLCHMRQEGMAISALFGIADFYHQFGFAPALVDSEFSVLARYAEKARLQHEVREFRPEDAGTLVEIYTTLRGAHSGSVVRDRASWKAFTRGAGWTSRVGAYVVIEGTQILGYAAYNFEPQRFALAEVGYRDPSIFETLLAEAARRAIALRLERIPIHGPLEDPFARYCRRYGAECKLHYPYNAGGMARIIDQPTLFAQLQPLWRGRMAEAGLSAWSGTLVIETELGVERLDLGGETPELRIRLPQALLTQLLFGYRSVDDALFESGAIADDAARPILRALFPDGQPYMWPNDRF